MCKEHLTNSVFKIKTKYIKLHIVLIQWFYTTSNYMLVHTIYLFW